MIEVEGLRKLFPVRKGLVEALVSAVSFQSKQTYVKAVNGVSFSIERGEVMGFAGESGCGKTTTGLLLLRLYQPTEGRILFDGQDIALLKGRELALFRRQAQLIFQDPYESLNPRFTVRRAIEEPLIVNRLGSKSERRDQILHAMELTKLKPIEAFIDKYPHELSGGERQRVCIARAIVLNPILLVADEAVSMLDVSIRSAILILLRDLTEKLHMSTLYISHDLSLLGSVCDKIAIMYAGEIVEIGKPEHIIDCPLHPYTQALIAAVPVPEFDRKQAMSVTIKGEPPDLVDLPHGCAFGPRCNAFRRECEENKPSLRDVGEGHFVSCNLRR